MNNQNSKILAPLLAVLGSVGSALARNKGKNRGGQPSLNTAPNSSRPEPSVNVPTWTVNPITIGATTELRVDVSMLEPSVLGGEYYIDADDPGEGQASKMIYTEGSLFVTLGARLPPGTTLITVRAQDRTGAWHVVATTNLTVLQPIPAPPDNLNCPTPINIPVLTWSASKSADTYNIYRDGACIGSSLTTTYTDSTAENNSYDYNVTAVNSAGESGASRPISIFVDQIPPTLKFKLSQQPNSSGWFNSPVTVTFIGDDKTVGLASCTEPITLSSDGAAQTVTGTATNVAGDVATLSTQVNIDTTPPKVGIPVWSKNPIKSGVTTMLSVPVSDDVSGVIGGEYVGKTDPGAGHGQPMALGNGSLQASFIPSLSPGLYIVRVRALDTAGNWSPLVSTLLVILPRAKAPVISPPPSMPTETNIPAAPPARS